MNCDDSTDEQTQRPPAETRRGGALERFLASMQVTFDVWHDGTGYDLDLLERLTPDERAAAEDALIRHGPRDWRDVEALARFPESTRARRAIEEALTSTDIRVRREAMRHAGERSEPGDRERLLVRALEQHELYGGLAQAIDEAAEFHPSGVIDALFRGALRRDGEAAVHFAALLMFIHGKANEPFGWNHRPLFLRFNTTDRGEREAAFRDLCAIIGVNPEPHLR